MTENLDAIETALAHHDRQIQDLSDMIAAQWKEIDRLKSILAKTEARLQDVLDTTQDSQNLTPTQIAARDKPPHY